MTEDEMTVSASQHSASGGYQVLSKATFDPRLRRYWFWQAALLMIVTFVGIVVLPFWLLGLGQIWTRKLFNTLESELTEKSLNYRKGLFFRVEKTIPLEQIQDLTIHEGPLLKALGICSLAVETAGQNTAGGGMARLTGIQDARVFRNEVLARRDALKQGMVISPQRQLDSSGDQGQQVVSLLTEIRDQLAVLVKDDSK